MLIAPAVVRCEAETSRLLKTHRALAWPTGEVSGQ